MARRSAGVEFSLPLGQPDSDGEDLADETFAAADIEATQIPDTPTSTSSSPSPPSTPPPRAGRAADSGCEDDAATEAADTGSRPRGVEQSAAAGGGRVGSTRGGDGGSSARAPGSGARAGPSAGAHNPPPPDDSEDVVLVEEGEDASDGAVAARRPRPHAAAASQGRVAASQPHPHAGHPSRPAVTLLHYMPLYSGPAPPVREVTAPPGVVRHTDACMRCGGHGLLLCCDGCPRAFHPPCVGLPAPPPEDAEWFCGQCTDPMPPAPPPSPPAAHTGRKGRRRRSGATTAGEDGDANGGGGGGGAGEEDGVSVSGSSTDSDDGADADEDGNLADLVDDADLKPDDVAALQRLLHPDSAEGGDDPAPAAVGKSTVELDAPGVNTTRRLVTVLKNLVSGSAGSGGGGGGGGWDGEAEWKRVTAELEADMAAHPEGYSVVAAELRRLQEAAAGGTSIAAATSPAASAYDDALDLEQAAAVLRLGEHAVGHGAFLAAARVVHQHRPADGKGGGAHADCADADVLAIAATALSRPTQPPPPLRRIAPQPVATEGGSSSLGAASADAAAGSTSGGEFGRNLAAEVARRLLQQRLAGAGDGGGAQACAVGGALLGTTTPAAAATAPMPSAPRSPRRGSITHDPTPCNEAQAGPAALPAAPSPAAAVHESPLKHHHARPPGAPASTSGCAHHAAAAPSHAPATTGPSHGPAIGVPSHGAINGGGAVVPPTRHALTTPALSLPPAPDTSELGLRLPPPPPLPARVTMVPAPVSGGGGSNVVLWPQARGAGVMVGLTLGAGEVLAMAAAVLEGLGEAALAGRVRRAAGGSSDAEEGGDRVKRRRVEGEPDDGW
jgi:hypothetical protein